MALAPSIIINLPGFPFQNVASSANIVALRAKPSASLVEGENLILDSAAAAGDGKGGVFTWVAASLRADNNLTVIRPDDKTPLQAGRWIVISDPFLIATVAEFGAVGDGIADDTGAFQDAVTFAQTNGIRLLAPGQYRLTSTISATKGLTITGDGSRVETGVADDVDGSWLYFDHTGIGLSIVGTGIKTDFILEDIGTRRNQPTPAPGWTPNPHDFDIDCLNAADVTLRNIIMLNATRGVRSVNSGRFNTSNVRGQFMITGLDIDQAYDVCRFDDIHAWPFWRDDANVHAWTTANMDVISMARCDNPMGTNLFSIYARSLLRFRQSASGSTSKVHFANLDADLGNFGIWVDPTVTNGVTGQIVNMTQQGAGGLSPSIAVKIEGNNSKLEIAQLSSVNCGQNTIRIEGTGNSVTVLSARAQGFDLLVGGFPAFEVNAGNTLTFVNVPVATGGGVGGIYAGAGVINVDAWRTYVPTVTSQTGAITAHTTTARYKRLVGSVTAAFDILVTNNGTGATAVNVTLPVAAPVSASVGAGRELVVNGHSFAATVLTAGTAITLTKYDNTYPAATNARLVGSVTYEVAA